MKLNSFLLKNGILQSSIDFAELMQIKAQRTTEIWYDIQDAEIDELQRFLSVLDLHPLMLNRCLDKSSTPGVISFGETVMLEYPVSTNHFGFEPSYISIILQYPILITIRHNTCPVLDDFVQEYVSRNETGIIHLVQLLYLIIDEITDLSVKSETELRDKIIEMSRKSTDNPATVKEKDLNDLRWEVEKLVSLNENQLYCVHSLSASDNPSLNEPHRKAYIQDLASEVEIARNGILRLI